MKWLVVLFCVTLLSSCKEMVENNFDDLKKGVTTYLQDEFIEEVKWKGQLLHYFDKEFPKNSRDNKLFAVIEKREDREPTLELWVTYKMDDSDMNWTANYSCIIVTDNKEYILKSPATESEFKIITKSKPPQNMEGNTVITAEIERDIDLITDKTEQEIIKLEIRKQEIDEEIRQLKVKKERDDRANKQLISGSNIFKIDESTYKMLDDMFSSKKVLVRYKSDEQEIIRVVSQKEIEALKRVVESFKKL